MSVALLALSLMASAQDTPPDATSEGAPAPMVYSFGPTDGRLAALVFESTKTENSGRSHHHVVVAGEWSGRLRWAPGPECAGEFKVSVAGLVADAPEERKREDLGPPLAEADQKAVNQHLRARDQLFAERFPTIQYQVQDCSRSADGRHVIRGAFTLRGVAQPVAFRVQATETDAGLRLVGEGSITHSDFGFEPYYALFGQRQNQDRMRITLDVRGKPVGSDASTAAPITGSAD